MSRVRFSRVSVVRASILLAAAAGLASAAPSAAQEPSPRPVVLVLHGRGVQALDSTLLRREWLDALNRGLASAGGYPFLGEGDLRLVWYADALDPRSGAACADPAGEVATAPELASFFTSVGSLMALAAEWAGEAEGAALRSISGDLLYLGDGRKRCAAETRLADALARAALERRPVVLVAHSFGSLLAYHHLRTRPAPDAPGVERLVTIGSLVGRPELRELLVGADGRRTSLPDGVGSWVNVRDPRDPFASALLGVSAAEGAERVRDVETEAVHPGDPHDAGRYLADPATARAVLEAWCGARAGDVSAEPSCRVAEKTPGTSRDSLVADRRPPG